MKTKHTLLSIALLCIAATSTLRAESVIKPITDKVTAVAASVNETVASATNAVSSVNDAVASILMSGKAVGSEIYGASKIAITDSINFVSAQAPDIIKQFMLWRVIEASFYALGFLIFAIIIWYLGYRLRKDAGVREAYEDPSKSFFRFLGWVFIFAGFLPLVLGTGSWLMDIAKIYFVPKIYLIDYVLTLVKHN
jgi:hypothetical protein